ncbi:transcription regulator [Wallemia mellicola CBS 633.66]|uniref:Transcription regulator n=2 Tax=Wallemia mellicola TaxID=1708541 RepID=A0A4V4N4N6_9BASI|nr:transcription regulator [Wallemia mellicola CBS 633.66]TIC14260.1 transcription regulator [Wallemia mellicola]EIM23603.1 transcription regulator [Wallemia mellicola CBS 633.66]TIC32723.1 transcription regulator [Wallemia mellicola]TIC57244.1 transcription regulator [Wallemia mellicola]TIC69583.1 transcription regulator [Wallemia mellicola]|eukprot:XP_006956274.1 transcription regulator [Wallemia mellicola CBS 633.66]
MVLNRRKSRDAKENEDKPKKKMRMPQNTAFKQQRLRAWQPILTPKQVLPTLFIIGLVFAPIGAVLLSYSNRVHEFSLEYTNCNEEAPTGDGNFGDMPSTAYSYPTFDDFTPPQWSFFNNTDEADPSRQAGCTIRFDVPRDLDASVFMYYKLDRYYQNHRRYIKSFDQLQFQGKYRTAQQLNNADCKPLGDSDGKPIYPCGLIANSQFNDTFSQPRQLNNVEGDVDIIYNMTDKGIAWKHEGKKYKYPDAAPDGEEPYVPPPNWVKRYPGGVYSDEHPLPHLSEDEHFQVWMRPAAFPNFHKLYFRNDNDVMTTGTYEITAYMNYPVAMFGGKKSIVFSTVSWAGGRNPFLGICFIAVGAFCVFVGLIFTLRQLIKPRRVGDLTLLSWNQPNAKTE